MAAGCEPGDRIGVGVVAGAYTLQQFKLYESQSKFVMVGSDQSGTIWRVLMIEKDDSFQLNMHEDVNTYSEDECHDLLDAIHKSNFSTGGLKFVTVCYGIVGYMKFLGPYYMVLITQRRKIGSICGHDIYGIVTSEIITLSNNALTSKLVNSKIESRYKKLLLSVDMTKDFFFSYSYSIMSSLQKNMSPNETGKISYDSMFVWNEFMTRGIRSQLKNDLWTVALVYGFFKQVALSIYEKDFTLTLISRRSRYFAGTRYLKRGVNEKGKVANEVETEQIVFQGLPGGRVDEITSVVQHRGSIPLFWSQEASVLNPKPDIILKKKDYNFEATRLHFDNLVKRYGNPIIIWNLIKSYEKKPRESILWNEFANAIHTINHDLSEDNYLRFLHWDLNEICRREGTNVLVLLSKVAAYALSLTNFFHSQVKPNSKLQNSTGFSVLQRNLDLDVSYEDDSNDASDKDVLRNRHEGVNNDCQHNNVTVPFRFQNGILRTNCIDCLDRTNVAQYAFGLASFGLQLKSLNLYRSRVDLDDPLADELMTLYEEMGDTVALQYGGSGAHNKIFSQKRGQWKAATQSQELLRTVRRYCNNVYMDREKQNAINLFLGYFQPQPEKPAVWELDSDQDCSVERRKHVFANENEGSCLKRSFSDGLIFKDNAFPECIGLSDPSQEMSSHRINASASRCTPSKAGRQFFVDSEYGTDGSSCSNFLDFDKLSSSAGSYDGDYIDRSSFTDSPLQSRSSESIICEAEDEPIPSSEIGFSGKGKGTKSEFSDGFKYWVLYGETLCRDEFMPIHE